MNNNENAEYNNTLHFHVYNILCLHIIDNLTINNKKTTSTQIIIDVVFYYTNYLFNFAVITRRANSIINKIFTNKPSH